MASQDHIKKPTTLSTGVKVENRSNGNEFVNSSSSGGGVGEKSNRDVFLDAVQEFSDSGISPRLEERFEHVKETENSKDHETVEDDLMQEQLKKDDETTVSYFVDYINENGDGDGEMQKDQLIKKAEQDTNTQKKENLISSVTLDSKEVKTSYPTSVEVERIEVVCDNSVPESVSSDPSPLTETMDANSEVKSVANSSDSLEVKCGSVSDKSETNFLEPKTPTKEESHFDKSDGVYEAPSFMTLVQSSSEIKTEENNNSTDDVLQAAWFPSLTNMVNESEGRKKNEEIISKVTNWNQAKHDHIHKNNIPCEEAKSPKDNEPNKDQAASNEIEKEWDSPARYPIEIKKDKKKKKRKTYWVPFVCCSSAHRDL
ncbi:hypothetical protein ACJIZ3_009765 [Penstemon smallii]|uniref:Uncharacterized protein n=1 Tax=Penstemon smallii TaxID=265156 RepID=A0ABD3TDE5_9LAMI